MENHPGVGKLSVSRSFCLRCSGRFYLSIRFWLFGVLADWLLGVLTDWLLAESGGVGEG